MSHQTEEQAINLGHDCAMSAISAQRNVLANLSPPERFNWRVGFISAAMGAGVASVGDAAMRIIKGALTERRDAPSLSTRNKRSYLRRQKIEPRKWHREADVSRVVTGISYLARHAKRKGIRDGNWSDWTIRGRCRSFDRRSLPGLRLAELSE